MNDLSCLCPLVYCAIADFSAATNPMTGPHSFHWSRSVLPLGEDLGVFCPTPLLLPLPKRPGFKGISL